MICKRSLKAGVLLTRVSDAAVELSFRGFEDRICDMLKYRVEVWRAKGALCAAFAPCASAWNVSRARGAWRRCMHVKGTDGCNRCVGDEDGKCNLYDLRASAPHLNSKHLLHFLKNLRVPC